MVNGPPCAVCGFTLRWLPQQSSWGCDRCQRMFPASGPGAPQAQAAPSAWAPPGAAATSPQSPHAMQQGFAPPQQQGFAPPQQQGFQPPQQQGFQRPPQQQGYQPQPQQGFQPPQQQGFQPPGASQSHPPGANPYAPPGANPYAPPGAQHGAHPAHTPHPGATHPAGATPYAPHGAPAYGQAYSPHPATPAPAPAPSGAKKSSNGLLIGLAVAGLAVAGGVVAFVVMRGGGGIAGGGGRNDVIKSTLAALGDGDTDQLMRLTDIPGMFDKLFDCAGKTKPLQEPGEDDNVLTDRDKEERDPKHQAEKRKTELAELAARMKGAKIELVEIITKEPPAPKDDAKDGDDNEGVKKTGDKLTKGCVAKVPYRMHAAKVKLKVTPKGEAAIEQEADVTMLQIGTGFYLTIPPAISLGVAALEREFTAIKDKVCACKDAACAEKLEEDFKASPRRKTIKKEIKALSDKDKDTIEKIEDEIKACESKLGGGDQIAAMVQFKDKLCECTNKACADKVTQEMTVWGNSHKDAKLSEEDLTKASAIGDEMGKCVTRIYAADTGGDTGGAGGGIGATIASAGGVAEANDLPGGCIEYRELILKLANCPKLPQASRQALLDGWKAMADLWKNSGGATAPPGTAKAIEDGCRQGADALKPSMKQLGC